MIFVLAPTVHNVQRKDEYGDFSCNHNDALYDCYRNYIYLHPCSLLVVLDVFSRTSCSRHCLRCRHWARVVAMVRRFVKIISLLILHRFLRVHATPMQSLPNTVCHHQTFDALRPQGNRRYQNSRLELIPPTAGFQHLLLFSLVRRLTLYHCHCKLPNFHLPAYLRLPLSWLQFYQ